MKKVSIKVLSLMLLILMIPSLLVMPVKAYESDFAINISSESESKTIESDKCGDNVNYELYENGTLRIFGEGDMDDWSESFLDISTQTTTCNTPWYGKRNDIEKVIIESGVTSIGKYAFNNCINLKEVVLPDGIKTISTSSFRNCESLQWPHLPESVNTIDEWAFMGCLSFKTVDIVNTVSRIGNYAFRDCKNIEILNLPLPLSSIGGTAFLNCEKLSKIYFVGDKPSFYSGSEFRSFKSVSATVYYPENNSTWDNIENTWDGGGTMSFVPYKPEIPGYTDTDTSVPKIDINDSDSDSDTDDTISNSSITNIVPVGIDEVYYCSCGNKKSILANVILKDNTLTKEALQRELDSVVWSTTNPSVSMVDSCKVEEYSDQNIARISITVEGKSIGEAVISGSISNEKKIDLNVHVEYLTIGKDTNSFIHYGVPYVIYDSELKKKLYKATEWTFSGTFDTFVSLNSKQKGVCLGIAKSMCYGTQGMLDFDRIYTNVDNYWDLGSPQNNNEFSDILVYYTLLQFSDEGIGSRTLDRYGWHIESLENRTKAFLKDFVKEAEKSQAEEKPFLLSFKYKHPGESDISGHSVVVCGYKWNDTEKVYEIKIYDENSYKGSSAKYTTFKVAQDYSSFDFADSNAENLGYKIENVWTSLYYQSIDSLYNSKYIVYQPSGVSENNDYMTISISNGAKFRLENEQGEWLSYDGEEYKGNMTVYDCYTSGTDDVSHWNIKINKTSKLVLTNSSAGCELVAQLGEKNYAVVSDGADMVVLQESGVKCSGGEYHIEAATQTEKYKLVQVKTDVSGDIEINNNGNGVIVIPSGECENAAVQVLDGTETKIAIPSVSNTGELIINDNEINEKSADNVVRTILSQEEDLTGINNSESGQSERYGKISQSYFYTYNNNYYVVYHNEKCLTVKGYDNNHILTFSKSIDDELVGFGGFYSGSNYNFVVYGKRYGGETDKETYRIVKYDKDFNRLGSVSFNGDDTYTNIPFDACNSSFAEKDGVLVFYAGRERLDGHQSNVTLRININDMTVADDYAGAASLPINHASHNFRGLVRIDENGDEIYANLSDGHPCYGVNTFIINKNGELSNEYNVVYTQVDGDEYNIMGILNVTFGEVTGLSVTDTSYIYAGVYYDNVFVASVNKSTGEIQNTFLTNYGEYNEYGMAQGVKLVSVGRNTNILLWQTIENGIPAVKYVKVNNSGMVEGEIKTAFDTCLSDCQPICNNGTIQWFTIKDGVNTLYSITDLDFYGVFKPIGSTYVDSEKVWDGTADTSWYSDDNDVFEISTAEQLAGLAKLVNSGNDMYGKNFNMKNDIFLNSDLFERIFTPIAKLSSKVKFSGIFDGCGHTIYGLYRYETNKATEGGLFGAVGLYGAVKCLKVEQSYIIQDNCGAIAATNFGSIMFCENKGKVKSAADDEPCYHGGIVGINSGMVYGCINKGRVSAYSGWTGGICGDNTSIQGCVKCCINEGYVCAGGFAVGGITGYNERYATVEDCAHTGLVSGLNTEFNFDADANCVGGIVGYTNCAYIVNCISVGNLETAVSQYPYLADQIEFDSVCAHVSDGYGGSNVVYDCYSIHDTAYGEKITLGELVSEEFIKKLNTVTDFYETRINDIWVKGDYLPITIAQKADELNFYKFYPTPCFSSSNNMEETHFGYAETFYEMSDKRIITGNGVGKATLTVIIPETEASAEERHTFEYEKFGVAFDEDLYIVKIGDDKKINITKYLKPNDSGEISFYVDDKDVASISEDGIISGKNAGCTTITAKYGSYSSVCRVYVTKDTDILSSGLCGNDLYYKLDETGTLRFSGSGEMTSAPWKDYVQLIKRIKFNTKMTSVCQNAFENCQNIEEVEVPSNIVSIGDNAFYGCTALKAVLLNDGIKEIGEYAFAATSICEITIPSSVEKIGGGVLNNCNSITNIYSYSKCDDNQNLLPNGTNKTKSDIRFIGTAAKTVVSACRTFGCKFISMSNPSFVLTNTSDVEEEIVLKKYTGDCVYVTVPDEIDGMKVTAIASECFLGNVSLEHIECGANISTIEEGAFKDCESLRSIVLPETLDEISDNLFYNCGLLSDIIIPNGILSIGECAFCNCESLKEIYLPDKTKTISERAFYNCKLLRRIRIPESTDSIQKYAFYGCDSLKSIVVPADLQSVSVYGYVNDNLTTIYGKSELLKETCSDSEMRDFISAYYYDIPTELTSLTADDISVTGFFPPNTQLEYEQIGDSYRLRYVNNGHELEPYGAVKVTISNSDSELYVYDADFEKLTNAEFESGQYTFDLDGDEFCFLQEYSQPDKINFVLPETIRISDSFVNLETGDKKTITADVLPQNATDLSVKWLVSNPNVISVNSSGEITALSPGISTVYSVSSNTITDFCVVTVTRPKAEVENVVISKTEATLLVGESIELNAYTEPDDTTNDEITWTTSDEKIVLVNNGIITAIASGTARIYAKTENGKSVFCAVTVKAPVVEVTGLELNKTNIELFEGESEKLTVKVVPEDATFRKIEWISSDTSIATVDEGNVTAISQGHTVITATASNGIQVTCEVTVKEKKDDPTLTPDPKPIHDPKTIGNLGDIDGDGEITSNDALTILRSSVGMADLTPEQNKLADVDNDGEITSNDALVILRYSVGMADANSPINKPVAA